MNTLPASLPVRVLNLLNLKGQFVSITTVRPIKVKVGVAPVLKVSKMVVRMGCEYDSQKAVQEKRENGTLPAENQGLSGREWIVPNYLMKSLKSGKILVRCTPVNGNDTSKRSVTFLRGGVPITREEAAVGAYASEFADREPVDAFDVTADNIVEVNGQPV